MRWRGPGWTTAVVITLILLVSFAVQAHSALNKPADGGHCTLPDIRTDARPGPANRPTQVTVGLRLIDVTEIEDTSQTITADFVVSQTWADPRLAAFKGCRFKLDEVWTPNIDIINSGRVFTRLPQQVEVLEAGRIRYLQRYRGALVFVYDARRFPFDQHDIVISLISLEKSEKAVSITIDKDFTGRRGVEFNVPDWKVSEVQASVASIHLDAFNRSHAKFDFSISAKRLSGFYIWKVIVPLMLIVFMSWTVFWIDPAHFSTQIGMSATSMLTLIAFQFAMANILPRLSYYTVLDKFIAGSTILVFLALIESVTTSYLFTKERKKTALQMDRACRWAFPVVFVAFTLYIFSV